MFIGNAIFEDVQGLTMTPVCSSTPNSSVKPPLSTQSLSKTNMTTLSKRNSESSSSTKTSSLSKRSIKSRNENRPKRRLTLPSTEKNASDSKDTSGTMTLKYADPEVVLNQLFIIFIVLLLYVKRLQ